MLLSPHEMQKHLTTIVFNDEPTIKDLFSVVVAFAILWFIIFSVAKAIIRPLVHNKKWLLDAIDKDYERGGKKMFKDLKINVTKQEFIAFAMKDWPRMQSIYLQHFVGSFLCIPSILGIGDPSVASSLAVCGILSEMGWELQDMLEILFVRAFYENGEKLWPTPIVIIFLIHHSLASCLGIPMIIYYRHHRTLHWLCFDLQFAAGLAMSIGEITKLLDVTNPRQLRQFKVLNFIALATMVWTRIIHWTYLTTTLFITFYNEKAWTFLFSGITISIGFSGFSYVCCVRPFYKRFVNFLHVSAEYEALPPDASPDKRRSSVIQLDLAVAELLEAEAEILPIMFQFQSNKVSRRQSVPVLRGRRGSLLAMMSKSVGHEITKSKDF